MKVHSTSNSSLRAAVLVAGLVAIAAPAWGQLINEDLKLLASDGAAYDSFSYRSIAIDNGVVAVGAFNDDDNGVNSGSAYLFDASTGAQIAKLLPTDGATGDWFGNSIAIDNGIVAVGAYSDDDNGTESGSAYLFDASTGAQITKLLPTDGAERDFFGQSIAIDNGIVAVGSPYDDYNGVYSGSAYLFDASTGAQIAKLLPTDGYYCNCFGNSIAIDNGIVAVGSHWYDDYGTAFGAAYLFDASTGAQIAKLHASDSAYGDKFGESIAIEDSVVAVGARGDDDYGYASGSVYLFDASTGAQIAKLHASDGGEGDCFGNSIAIDNGVMAVGAYHDGDNRDYSGSAYLFDASTGAQIAKLLASDGAYFDMFGESIAIDNGIVAVGAFNDNDNGTWSGSAYLFQLSINDPPEIECLDPVVLWSPNHELVDVSSAISVSDPDGDPVSLTFHVFSDEPEIPDTGDGTGRHAPDFKDELFEGGRGLLVRSERRGSEDGRFYAAVITADDGYGGVTEQVCVLAVCPHDQNDPASLDAVLAQADAGVVAIQTALMNNESLPPYGMYEHGLSEPLGPIQ